MVSQQQYIKIIKFFEILLDKHSQKRDTLMFANKLKGSIIEALVVKEDFDNFYLKPIVDMGALTGYKFTLPKKKVFFGEDKTIRIGNKISVV